MLQVFECCSSREIAWSKRTGAVQHIASTKKTELFLCSEPWKLGTKAVAVLYIALEGKLRTRGKSYTDAYFK